MAALKDLKNAIRRCGLKVFQLVPFWCLPASEVHQTKIERYVPMYPFSQDQQRYDRIIKVLSLYRLTLGQPHQEELIPLLDRELPSQSLQQLFMNLSPFYRQLSLTSPPPEE